MTNDDLSGLNNESELPHLSDAISYATDIAPYRIIKIFSGVGNGKNTFVNRFVTGDPERKIPQMTVLVITSRSSKVSEQLADKKVSYAAKIGKWGNISKQVYDDGDLERFQANVRTITNEWGKYQVKKYVEIFVEVFPAATIQLYKDRLDQMREFVEAQLDGDPKREFTKDQLTQHKAELNRIRFDEPDQYIKKMNTLLKLIGYEVRRVSKDSKKPGYHRWRYHLTESLQLAS